MKKTVSIFILLTLCISLFAQKPYRGGEVFSKDKVLYGKFVMHMKMIKGSGMLSTFYTIRQSSSQNDAYWAELDIEVLGKNNAQTMSTNIITDGAGGKLVHSTKEVNRDFSLADDFHTFTLEWTPKYVAWFIDGVELRRETGAVVNHLNTSQGYRFNSWISCSPGWVGPIERDSLPRYQYVDWIEYYSYNTSTEVFTIKWRDDFNSFNTARWSKANWTFDCNEVDFVSENVFIKDGKLVLAITDPNPPVGISEKPIQNNFTAKYTPDSNEIRINCVEDGNYKTRLYDLTGRLLLSKQFNSSGFSFSCLNIKRGLYIICVNNRDNWYRQKILIE
jgi:beta-glucanase (GH16 family)